MTPVRTALVGLGDIGITAHLPALLRNQDVRVAAVVDPDPAKTVRARERVDAPAFPDIAGVLDYGEVDAVVLATPPWVTTGLIGRVAATGRYVLAEKPVATSFEAARPLRALPREQARLVQVGLTYRHDPALELLRDWLNAGRLGAPVLVRAHIYDEQRRGDDPEHAHRIETTLRHGMPVLHEGAHVFDWLGYLFGSLPTSIHDAWSLSTRDGLGSPNLCGARLCYPDGTTVLAEFGWLTDALPRAELDLLGDKGHAVLDGPTFALTLTTADGQVERVGFEPDRVTRCFDRQLARFVELCTGRRATPDPDLADGLAALEISEQVARRAGKGSR